MFLSQCRKIYPDPGWRPNSHVQRSKWSTLRANSWYRDNPRKTLGGFVRIEFKSTKTNQIYPNCIVQYICIAKEHVHQTNTLIAIYIYIQNIYIYIYVFLRVRFSQKKQILGRIWPVWQSHFLRRVAWKASMRYACSVTAKISLLLVQGFIQASVGLVLLNNCFRREGDQIQETSWYYMVFQSPKSHGCWSNMYVKQVSIFCSHHLR